MGRREIINGVLVAVLGAGAAAMLAGLAAPTLSTAPYLVWGGLVAIVVSVAGLYRLYKTTPGPGASATTREYIPPEITPQVLAEKIAGRTGVQIDAVTKTYSGKWMRHEGEVRDVVSLSDMLWMMHLAAANSPDVSGIFDKKWHQQLAALKRGDCVTIEGQIGRLKNGPTLECSEIVHIGRLPKPPAPARRKRAPKAPS